MNKLIITLCLSFTVISGIFTWIALMFASLPGAETSYSLKMRIVRGLFYFHPFWVVLSYYYIHNYAHENSYALLWCAAPFLTVAITWFIFSLNNP